MRNRYRSRKRRRCRLLTCRQLTPRESRCQSRRAEHPSKKNESQRAQPISLKHIRNHVSSLAGVLPNHRPPLSLLSSFFIMKIILLTIAHISGNRAARSPNQ
jgi:hypothetical protein